MRDRGPASRPPRAPVDNAQAFGRITLLCALVGILAGVGAIAFDVLVSAVGELLMGGLAGFDPVPPGGEHRLLDFERPAFRPAVLALLPVLGGFLGALLTLGFAPEAQGSGTDAAIDAFHNRQGRISSRIPFVKTLASALTLGTGGSAGREGPIAQVGAGLGSLAAAALGLNARERRLLMVAGMAAGIGAMFRAPLAAALFSAEILYREMDMEFEVIVPSVISAIVGYSVFTLAMGSGALFSTPAFAFASPFELLPYTILALVVALGARSYVRLFHFVSESFRTLRVPPLLKPIIGGLGAGLFAFFLPEALGHGYGIVQGAFDGEVGWQLLLAVALAKTVTTALTVGSGQAGGVFGPAIVIGGALSGALGTLLVYLMGPICPPPGAFVLVGMAGFFSAAANTPISTIIMVSEITGNYRLLVPSMWVCVIAFTLVRRSSLYLRQLDRRTDSPVHLGEMMGEVLDRLSVRHALSVEGHEPVAAISANAPLSELKVAFSRSHHAAFPVVSADGNFVGVVDDQALRLAICDDAVRDVLVAADLVETAPSLEPSESLHSAMHKMVSSGHDELVVVEEAGEGAQLVGMLSRRDLVAAYDHQIQRDQDLRDRTNETAWAFFTRTRRALGSKKAPPPSEGGGGGGTEGGGVSQRQRRDSLKKH